MPEFKLLIFVDPLDGQDDDFNHWYDNNHVPDALTLKGFKRAQRFVTGPTFLEHDAPTRYLVIYDVEAERIEEALAIATESHSRFYVSPSVDLDSLHAYPLTPLGPSREPLGSEDA